MSFGSNFYWIHHVGGRNGSGPFPVIQSAEAEVARVFYDADPNCIAHAMQQTSSSLSRTYVLPKAVGGTNATRHFHHNWDPNTSSFLPSSPKLNYLRDLGPFEDYVLGEAICEQSVEKIEVQTLESILKELPQLSPPDFLSLDTQGTELEILCGCESILDQIVGVCLEVSFVQFYDRQPLFEKVLEWAKAQRFELYSLDGISTGSRFRGPWGSRGRAQIAVADALLFRQPTPENAYSLGFAALAFGFTDLSLECFSQIEREPESSWEFVVYEFGKLTSRSSGRVPRSSAQSSDYASQLLAYEPRKYGVAALTSQGFDLEGMRHFWVGLLRRTFLWIPLRSTYRSMRALASFFQTFLFQVQLSREIKPYVRFAQKHGHGLLQELFAAQKRIP